MSSSRRRFIGMFSVAMILTILISATLAGFASQPPASIRISVDEAYKMAFAKAPSMRIAKERLNGAEANAAQAEGQLRPGWGMDSTVSTNNLHLLDTRISATLTVPLAGSPEIPSPGQGFSGGPSPAVTGMALLAGRTVFPWDESLYRVDALPQVPDDMPAFAAPVSVSVYLARLGLDSARLSFRKALWDLEVEVRASFYAVQKARSSLSVALQAEEIAEAGLDSVNARRKSGVSTGADVLKAQSQLSQASLGVLRARNSLQAALMSLRFLLGLDPGTELDLAEPAEDTGIPPIPPGLTPERLVQIAFERRAEVRDARIAVTRGLAGLISAEMRERVGVVLSGRYSQDPFSTSVSIDSRDLLVNLGGTWVLSQEASGGSGGGSSGATWSVSARVVLPQQGASTDQAKLGARADLASAQAALERQLQSVEQEVRQSYNALVEAELRYRGLEPVLAASERGFETAKARYQAGVITSSELEDAGFSLAEARNQLLQARYEYLAARSKLERAVELERLELGEEG